MANYAPILDLFMLKDTRNQVNHIIFAWYFTDDFLRFSMWKYGIIIIVVIYYVIRVVASFIEFLYNLNDYSIDIIYYNLNDYSIATNII